MRLKGWGNGKGDWVTLRRSRLHMLSYARIMEGNDCDVVGINDSSQCNKIRNT